MRAVESPRGLVAAGWLVLCAGFLYSGFATLRLYGQVLQESVVTGPFGTIDGFLKPVNLSSGSQLRLAVERAGWPSDADVVLRAPDEVLSRQDLYQVYYSTSYLLYPRRVWLDSPSASDGPTGRHESGSRRGSRYVVLIGSTNSLHHRHHPVSDMIALAAPP
jgi:hypothetical protein